MNSPVRSLDKPKNHLSWLRFGLKQNWQQFMFYAIVMLLACVVTSIIGVDSALSDLRRYGGSTMLVKGSKLFLEVSAIFAVVSCVLGVFAGMSATGYVNSRRAVHCYHSLPLTRDALYVTGSAVQGIYYLVSGLGAMLIGTLCIAIRLGIDGEHFGKGMMLILAGIGGYLVVFSLFQLSGSLTGTAIFRFIVAGLIAFLPILLYALVILAVGYGMDHIQVDHYTSDTAMRFLCPAVNLYYVFFAAAGEIDNVVNGLYYTGWQTLAQVGTLYLTAAVYYGLGYYFHRIRRSELSENSLIWKKLRSIVKYPVIFVGGAGGALFFRALMGKGGSWTLFGCLCGLVLSFLLMNVLIARNTKSMFQGLPGLGATAVVVAVFLAVFLYDVFDFNTFMYPTDKVESVTIQWNSMTLELTDKDDIAAVMPYIQNMTTGENNEANNAYADSTAFYIDPDKVIGQNSSEAEKMLKTLYKDRCLTAVDGTSQQEIYSWMSGGLFDDLKYVDDIDVIRESSMTKTTAVRESVQYRYDYEYGGNYTYTNYRIQVSVYPKHGLPVHRWMRCVEISPDAAIFDKLEKMTAYQNQYLDLATVSMDAVYDLSIEFADESMWLLLGSSVIDFPEASAAYYQKLEELIHAAGQFDTSMTSTPVIGALQVCHNGSYVTYPLYAGMTPFWNQWLSFWDEMPSFLSSYGVPADAMFASSMREYYDQLRYTDYTLYESGETIMDWVTDHYTGVYVIEADTGRALYVDAPAEILEQTTLTNVYGPAGKVEQGYLIVARKYSIDNLKDGKMTVPDGRSIAGEFLAGKVPQFVLDAFAK